MNREEAKEVLRLFRADSTQPDDPQVAEALQQAQRDPELREWLERSCAFHAAMRQRLQQLPVPTDLPQAILARSAPVLGRSSIPVPLGSAVAKDRQKIIRPVWRQRSGWLAAAAGVAVLLGLAVLWLQPRTPDRFSDYRSRMIRNAARRYRMDILTNDLNQVRQFLARRGAPADFVLPNGLDKLSVTGGVSARWRGHPVSMVCFDRGDKQMLFLFVVDRSAVKDPPPATQVAKVNQLLTSSWSQGDKTYVLAGPEDTALLRK